MGAEAKMSFGRVKWGKARGSAKEELMGDTKSGDGFKRTGLEGESGR